MDIKEFQGSLTDAIEQAMIREVWAAPKPGLVDRCNSGSHADMDAALFIRSAQTLKPWFGRFMAEAAAAPDDLVLPRLRHLGRQAEADMLRATRGINTHKGLIFSLGILSACLIRLCLKLDRPPGPSDTQELIDLIRLNTRGVTGELDGHAPASHGRRVYETHGFKGIRQEAEDGFPALFQTGLPALARHRRAFSDPDLPLLLTLLELILVTDDTNLVRRGGLAGLAFMRESAQAILDKVPTAGSAELLERLRAFDAQAIGRNLSPGGAADNLALTIFLDDVLTCEGIR